MKYFIFFIVMLSSTAFSQELNCTISVNMDNLGISERPLLSGFQSAVNDYMNKTRFTNSDWKYDRINCAMNILMLTATSDGSFTAQVIVTSQRPIYHSNKVLQVLRINDPSWAFTYQKGQALYSNQSTFDPLTSFLDYYAFMIIGFNEETWTEYGGTQYFNRAINIDNLAMSSSYAKGWVKGTGLYDRESLVENVLNDKYRPFREAFFQYYYGIDYYENVNKENGMEKIAATMRTIASLRDKIDFASVLIRVFFDANSGTIVSYLKNYPDKSIFALLKKIDPSHTGLYDNILLSSPQN